jgi:hypothetical protein
MRSIRRLLAAGLVASALAVVTVAPAAAYGNAGGAQQLYQVSASMNCNNVTVCGSLNLGGFWAWGVFYADGTFDAEITFCGHVSTPAGPGLAGAGHEHSSGTYAIVDFGQGPWIVLTSEVDVLTGRGHGTTITVSSEFMPIAPAWKAHLSAVDFFGFTAPGVTFNVTVTPMHT